MPVPTKCSSEEKLKAVQDYFSNKKSVYRIAKDFNTRPTVVFKWIDLYEMFGAEGLITPSTKKIYSHIYVVMTISKNLQNVQILILYLGCYFLWWMMIMLKNLKYQENKYFLLQKSLRIFLKI